METHHEPRSVTLLHLMRFLGGVKNEKRRSGRMRSCSDWFPHIGTIPWLGKCHYRNFARQTAITLIADTGIRKYPAPVQPIDSASLPNIIGPMNIPRFCPKASTAIPNPANCRDTIISGTAANVAGTMVPATTPNPIVSSRNHPSGRYKWEHAYHRQNDRRDDDHMSAYSKSIREITAKRLRENRRDRTQAKCKGCCGQTIIADSIQECRIIRTQGQADQVEA